MSACCEDCGAGVNPDRVGTWLQVVGWTVKRAQGGANAIRMPRPTGRVLCADCGRKRDLGITPGQEGLDL